MLAAQIIERIPTHAADWSRVRERWRPHWLAYKRVAPLGFIVAFMVWAFARDLGGAWDMHAYWFAGQSAAPYGVSVPGEPDAYLYSPAFLQLISPLTHLPWPTFAAIWWLILAAGLYVVAREWAPLLLLIPVVASELGMGNIHLLLAAVLVFGFRRPGLWAFALLTKPTLGLCLLWFVARREWRNLAEALVTTTVLAAVSALVAPTLWREWIGVGLRGASGPMPPAWTLILPWPWWLRLVIATAIMLVAIRRDWRVLVPVAAVFSLPEMGVLGASMLVACVPLARAARETERPLETAPRVAYARKMVGAERFERSAS